MKTIEIIIAIFFGTLISAAFMLVIFCVVSEMTANRKAEKKLEEERKARDAAFLQSIKEEGKVGMIDVV